ncbi:DNA glycosylase [Fistulina hepatica ATCC 64428]|uniref:Adenine DNA glycosylase n=1 Tax=Fistulina hepatica ATCC 64428 TaxID=1128425 RepID=A0A0D7A2V5_9AGAR|nr:DNA glycosylase [Fistulina hepatica ATCC 64428]
MPKRAHNRVDDEDYSFGGLDASSDDAYEEHPRKSSSRRRVQRSQATSGTADTSDALSVPHSSKMHVIDAPDPIRIALLAWYDGVHEVRGMPWRKPFKPNATPDERAQRAYEAILALITTFVWVSEIMLQQTQVTTVIAYYNKWMAKFPTLSALAEASIEDVNALWKGLGYYSRASRLLAGAQKAVKEYDGRLPDNAKLMEANIPGIGRYSAGAICSIAYGERVPVLDGNVTRLLSRFLAMYAQPKSKGTQDVLWAAAAAMVRAPQDDAETQQTQYPGDTNQALIELGSTICRVKDPKCGECPIRAWCKAYAYAQAGSHPHTVSNLVLNAMSVADIEDACTLCEPLTGLSVTSYPMKVVRKKAREELDVVNVLEWRPHADAEERWILLVRRPEGGLLAGLYEFPTIPDVTALSADSCTKSILKTYIESPVAKTTAGSGKEDCLHIENVDHKGDIVHVFSHIRKTYRVSHVLLVGSGDNDNTPPPLRDGDEAQAAKRPRKRRKPNGEAVSIRKSSMALERGSKSCKC